MKSSLSVKINVIIILVLLAILLVFGAYFFRIDFSQHFDKISAPKLEEV